MNKPQICILFLVYLFSLSLGWDIAEHLSTKTPYRSHNNSNINPPEGCVPYHFQLVSRHGSRYPTGENILKFIELEKMILNNQDKIPIPWLKNWTNPFFLKDEGLLVVGGERELYYLGKRFNDKYQMIFPDNKYHPLVYPLQTTFVPRASMSGNVFAFAIFGEHEGNIGPDNYQPLFSFTDTKGRDVKLRFFEACKKYASVKNGDKMGIEKSKFADLYFPDIAKSISQKIGFKVSAKNVSLFFELCSFEVVNFNETKNFCSLFTQEDLETIELYYDISSYYTLGYGESISYEIACPLVSDIVNIMDRVVNGTDILTRAFLRFAHAETVVPLMARLGLYKDPFKLTCDTDKELLAKRKWRMSIMSTFSSNLAFVLHKCERNEYKVEILLNEGQIKLDGCDIFCPYEQFKSILSFVNKCNFDALCENELCGTDDSIILPKDMVVMGVIFGIFIVSLAVGLISYFSCSSKYKRY